MSSNHPPDAETPNKSTTSKDTKRKVVGIACDECRSAKAKCSGTHPCVRCTARNCACSFEVKRDALLISRNQTVRFREALSSLHDILRRDGAAARRLERKARETASLPAFIDDIADEGDEHSATIGVVILPLVLLRNASKEELLDLIYRLRSSGEDEDPQSIVEHHLHKLQQEIVHRTPLNDRLPPVASESTRSEAGQEWDPLLRRTDQREVLNIPSSDEAETGMSSTTMDQGIPRASSHMTANLAASWEQNWEQGRYPYPHPSYSVTSPVHVQGFGNLPFSSAIKANHYPPAQQWQQLTAFSSHEYQIRSLALWEDSPIANLFYRFQDHAFQSIANGTPVSTILGSGIIDVELIFRDRTPDDPYDVCSWACEMWKNVVNYDIYVILASCVPASGLMRWNLFPTAENYVLCPPMSRPTTLQRFIPHSMPIDLVPHPIIRDSLIREYRDWLTPGTVDHSSTSIGWPYSLREAVEVHPVTGRRQLTPAFVAHAMNPDNWSVKRSIERVCPDIEKEGFHIRDE